MKIAFLTLGCKVNSYETEKMKQNFEEAGHQIVSFSERADVYIINTCTVTNIADRKSRQMLHRARRDNPDAVVAATGCYVDSAADRGEREEGIDFFVANKDKENIVEILEKSLAERKYVRRSSGDGVQEEARIHAHILRCRAAVTSIVPTASSHMCGESSPAGRIRRL